MEKERISPRLVQAYKNKDYYRLVKIYKEYLFNFDGKKSLPLRAKKIFKELLRKYEELSFDIVKVACEEFEEIKKRFGYLGIVHYGYPSVYLFENEEIVEYVLEKVLERDEGFREGLRFIEKLWQRGKLKSISDFVALYSYLKSKGLSSCKSKTLVLRFLGRINIFLRNEVREKIEELERGEEERCG